MKVKIGPYSSDLIHIHRKLEDRYQNYQAHKRGIPFFDYVPVSKLDKLVEALAGGFDSIVLPINRWSNSRKRKVDIHIDNYDVWGADQTLALIIHPVLVKLKSCKHGSPHVDLDDVPDGICDIHERWAWVLDEMIWAFEQHKNNDWEDQYNHNNDQLDISFKNIPGSGNSGLVVNRQKDPSKPAYWVDEEGIAKHRARMENGRRLFAKYYDGLWD